MSGGTVQAQAWQARSTGLDNRYGRGLPYLIWLALAAVALAGGVVMRQAHHNDIRSFEVPVHNLPAFHIISARDVRAVRLPASQVPHDALATANSVIGRVTLTEIDASMPVTESKLGPVVNGPAGGLTVIGTSATAAMALNGRLHAGDRIGIFARKGRCEHPDAIALVLSVDRVNSSERPYILIVSLPDRTSRIVIERLSTGTAWIVREPGS
jgi:SAF domain